jgi:hypothetical protein
MTRLLNLNDSRIADALVSNADYFSFKDERCPNQGAYACDRRRQREYIANKTFYLTPFIMVKAGDRVVIEDGGNIAAGAEIEAWIIR